MVEWATNATPVNGVFKGGGARGIAYAGALTALAERNVRFGAVAGASAGAITAALLAAGVQPTEFADISRDGLEKVNRRLLKAVLLGGTTHDSGPLARWFEGQLQCRVRGTSKDQLPVGDELFRSPVSFEELVDTFGIDLFVVTMDLHRRSPVVFSAGLTPTASVTAAVMASCAIPGALPSGRAVFGSADEVVIDQLVDGGSFANFPEFVFTSSAFQSWYRGQLKDDECGRKAKERLAHWKTQKTYGFVLGPRARHAQQPVQGLLSPLNRKYSLLDRGTSTTSGSPLQYLVSKVIGTHTGRVSLAIGLLSVTAMAMWALPRAIRGLAITTFTWPDWISWAWPLITIGVSLALLLTLAAIVLTAIALAAVGMVVSSTVIPAGLAALGVATGVPPWVGAWKPEQGSESAAGSRDLTVLKVPAESVTTLSFRVKQATRRAVIHTAHESVGYQMCRLERNEPEQEDDTPDREDLDPSERWSTLFVALLVILLLFGSLMLLSLADEHSHWARFGLSAGSLVCAIFAMVLIWNLLQRGAIRAKERSDRTVTIANEVRQRMSRKIAGGIVLLVLAGGMLIGFGVRARDEFEPARIITFSTRGGVLVNSVRTDDDPRSKRPMILEGTVSLRGSDHVLISKEPTKRNPETRSLSTFIPLESPFWRTLLVTSFLFFMICAGAGLLLSATEDWSLARHRKLAKTSLAGVPPRPGHMVSQ